MEDYVLIDNGMKCVDEVAEFLGVQESSDGFLVNGVSGKTYAVFDMIAAHAELMLKVLKKTEDLRELFIQSLAGRG